METEYGFHYTTFNVLGQVLRSGLFKSRALLVSEALRQRPDWETIKANPEAALPKYMRHPHGFLRHKPILNFSRQQFWEAHAGVFNESKHGKWADEEELVVRSMSDTFLYGGGLVRFGLRQQRLLGWNGLMRAAGFGLSLRVDLWFGGAIGSRYNSRFVMGLVAAALPLNEFDRVDTFVPFLDHPEGGQWIPFLYPRSIGVPSAREVYEAYGAVHVAITANMKESPNNPPTENYDFKLSSHTVLKNNDFKRGSHTISVTGLHSL
jgi:hypothetical protein